MATPDVIDVKLMFYTCLLHLDSVFAQIIKTKNLIIALSLNSARCTKVSSYYFEISISLIIFNRTLSTAFLLLKF